MTRAGDRLRAFAARWCCEDTMARVIDPLIADLQVEYADAVQRDRRWKSRWLQVGAWTTFFKVLLICLWTDALAWHRWTSDDRRAIIWSFVFSGVFIVAFTALELLTVPMPALRSSHSTASGLLLYLIPQALSISVTVGATFGILFGVGGRRFSGQVGAGLVALALVASAFSFVNMGWILPKANQAYRLATFGGAWMPKFPSELTLGEISRTIEVVRREPMDPSGWHFGDSPRYLRDLRYNYQSRWALSFSPLVFAWLALLMMRGCRRRWLLAIEAFGAFFGYYVLIYGPRALFLSGTMPASVAVWFPNAMCVAITAFLTIRTPGPNTWFYEPPR
jgi:hypothetical protein